MNISKMADECTPLRKRSSANRTPKRLLPRVDSNMLLQMIIQFELLGTKAALERPLLGVLQLNVSLHVRSRGTLVRAKWTSKGAHGGRREPAFHETTLVLAAAVSCSLIVLEYLKNKIFEVKRSGRVAKI